MKTLKTSRTKSQIKKQNGKKYKLHPKEDFETDSERSIEFSVSYPSQTKRSQSPKLRRKDTCCDCNCIQLKTLVQKLKVQNSKLATENQLLKQEVQKFKKQNQQAVESKSSGVKRLQTKNIECEQLKFRIKELVNKIDKLQKQNLNISMTSFKHGEDKEDTLNTICLQKEKLSSQDEIHRPIDKKLQEELAKYIEVKMKLDLTLRRLEQKQMLIRFLKKEQTPQQQI